MPDADDPFGPDTREEDLRLVREFYRPRRRIRRPELGTIVRAPQRKSPYRRRPTSVRGATCPACQSRASVQAARLAAETWRNRTAAVWTAAIVASVIASPWTDAARQPLAHTLAGSLPVGSWTLAALLLLAAGWLGSRVARWPLGFVPQFAVLTAAVSLAAATLGL